MGKMSGKAGNAVTPASPKKPELADVAGPGKVEEVEAEQAQAGQGKYGSSPAEPHKPPQTEEEKEQKKSWIEIELVGEDGKGIPGEKYRITLPDNTVAEGTLDGDGRARVEGFEKGTCKVCFPDIDKEALEKI